MGRRRRCSIHLRLTADPGKLGKAHGGYTRSVTRAVCDSAEARFDSGYSPQSPCRWTMAGFLNRHMRVRFPPGRRRCLPKQLVWLLGCMFTFSLVSKSRGRRPKGRQQAGSLRIRVRFPSAPLRACVKDHDFALQAELAGALPDRSTRSATFRFICTGRG